MSGSVTPRLSLPYMVVGQAQKELAHSQGIVRLDAMVQAVVQTVGTLNTPPGSPTAGQGWIVGSSPTGAWAGQANNLAYYINSSWIFVTKFVGMLVYNIADSAEYRWNGSAWAAVVSSGSPKLCIVRRTSAVTITSTTYTDISFQSAVHDPLGMWSAGTPADVVIPSGMNWVRCSGAVEWGSPGGGTRTDWDFPIWRSGVRRTDTYGFQRYMMTLTETGGQTFNGPWIPVQPADIVRLNVIHLATRSLSVCCFTVEVSA